MEMLKETLIYVVNTLLHNAPYLILGILVAAGISVYTDPDKLRQWLLARSKVSIPGSVAFGAFTPFWACGTMAVAISILATALPWGPIMAFLVSSPLMSPSDFVFYAGILGFRFAVALTLSSIFLGLAGGYISYFLEKTTHFFDGQIRFEPKQVAVTQAAAGDLSDGGGEILPAATDVPGDEDEGSTWGCSDDDAGPASDRNEKLREFTSQVVNLGLKRILPYFSLFAAIGYFVNKLVPTTWVMALFNGSHWYAVPLAAAIGLPLYVTGSSALPLLQVLMGAGASQGAVLAFLITGPATSVGVIAGISTIMKRRAIALYAAIVLVGGIVSGYVYDAFLRMM